MGGKRIVVGVDESAGSRAALQWAARHARAERAELLLVHAWETLAEYRPPYLPPRPPQETARRRAAAQQVLDAAAELVHRHHPEVVVHPRLEQGRAAAVLPRYLDGADLLVLGSTAPRTGDGRLGGVLLACLRRQACPVVVVSPDWALPPEPEERSARERLLAITA